MLLVRSYRTFAPLPKIGNWGKGNWFFPITLYPLPILGGIFLWHYPRDRSHWALPSKFGLSGARTFLKLGTNWLVCNRLRLLSTNTSVVLNDLLTFSIPRHSVMPRQFFDCERTIDNTHRRFILTWS